ncbi:MAG: PIN domain-containing protein [Chloroflexota bacterium]
MNIYVETNFILELVLQQEQSHSCENILGLCNENNVHLFIPAYCFAEPHEKLRRQSNRRHELQQALNEELKQLMRTPYYADRVRSIEDTTTIFSQRNTDEKHQFAQVQEQLLQIGAIIPLTGEILSAASVAQNDYELSPQDAIVFASVADHLSSVSHASKSVESCFLNRNSKDFGQKDIVDLLAQFNCKMIPKFNDGYRYIQSRTSTN